MNIKIKDEPEIGGFSANHTDAIIEIFSHNGLPVIVSKIGKYPKKYVEVDGACLKDVPHISIRVGGTTCNGKKTWGRAFMRRCDSKGMTTVWEERLDRGEYLDTPDDLVEHAKNHISQAFESDTPKQMRQELEDLTTEMPRKFDSVEQYEAYCERYGLEKLDPGSYEAKYWDGALGHYSARQVAKYLAVQALIRGQKTKNKRELDASKNQNRGDGFGGMGCPRCPGPTSIQNEPCDACQN